MVLRMIQGMLMLGAAIDGSRRAHCAEEKVAGGVGRISGGNGTLAAGASAMEGGGSGSALGRSASPALWEIQARRRKPVKSAVVVSVVWWWPPAHDQNTFY